VEGHKKICLNNEFSVISGLPTREEFKEKIKELSHDVWKLVGKSKLRAFTMFY